jgi:hypothetical protein
MAIEASPETHEEMVARVLKKIKEPLPSDSDDEDTRFRPGFITGLRD